jgi:hypothetical protein
MKVFVSTRATQGDTPGDFCFVPEGELVGRHHMVCDCCRYDDGCGCGRAFSGFVTRKGTTSAIVAERTISESEWRSALLLSLNAAGWGQLMSAGELARFVDDVVAHDLVSAAELPTGTIVGRRAWNEGDEIVDHLYTRSAPNSPAAVAW